MSAPSSPNLAKLADKLPTMSNGQPRKFRLYCECYEWVFNQFHGGPDSFGSVASEIDHAHRWAGALWDHQNPRGRSSLPAQEAE